MASKQAIHVVKNGNQWQVKREGSNTPISNHQTQATAETAGRRLAKVERTELVTHRPNGQIRDKDSYGKDLCPPRDTKH